MSDLFKLLLREFYELADWTPATASYVKGNGLDLEIINAHAGTIALLPCAFDDAGYFDITECGEQCCVFEVLDEDAATSIDLCAFSIADPQRFGSAMGSAPVLGLNNITNAASWAFDKKLRIHRNPLKWLRAGCSGTVILDPWHAPSCMARRLGHLLAEDAEHARNLRAMLCEPPVDPGSILFPTASAWRAA